MNRTATAIRRVVAPRWVRLVLGVSLAGGVAGAAPAEGGKATVVVQKLSLRSTPQLSFKLRRVRNSKGKVGCALFKGPAGFPMKPQKAYRQLWCPIVDHNATCSVKGSLPQGTYAAVCIHDENGNGTLDTNWIGLPKEGVVASNHAKGRFGPPSFKDAAFSVGAKPKTVRMRIGY